MGMGMQFVRNSRSLHAEESLKYHSYTGIYVSINIGIQAGTNDLQYAGGWYLIPALHTDSNYKW